jgi:hypothetical protein
MGLILAGFALIVLVDLIPIIQKRSGRSAFALLLFFIPALVLAVLLQLKIEVPSLMLLLGNLLKMLGINH